MLAAAGMLALGAGCGSDGDDAEKTDGAATTTSETSSDQGTGDGEGATQDAQDESVAPGDDGTADGGFSGPYSGFVRFGRHFPVPDEECVITVGLQVTLLDDGTVAGTAADQPRNLGGAVVADGDCEPLGAGISLQGSWSPDGEVLVTMGETTAVGTTNGTGLVFELDGSTDVLATTRFDGCAAANGADPAALCPNLLQEFEGGEITDVAPSL